MNIKTKNAVSNFFKKEFSELLASKLKKGHSLKKFSVNPFVLIALSSGVFGKASSRNMAKALLYPRVFGTSINTTFGDKMQKLCVDYLGATASSTAGMDIEFFDKIEKKQVVMQLKAGPNTINKGDVEPIIEEMVTAWRLLVQNKAQAKNIPTFAIGVTYGTLTEISGHYKKIASSSVGGQIVIPIYIGKDFWHRLTGEEGFYAELMTIFVELFEKEDFSKLLDEDLEKLSKQIEEKYFTNGIFDVTKV